MVKVKTTLSVIFFVGFFCVNAQKPQVLTFDVGGATFDMVLVEGGKFTMGASTEKDFDAYDDESPEFQVKISDFYIGKIEVTQQLYKAVMMTNPSHYRAYSNPVENVSWDDCQEFLTNLNMLLGQNFRLPTEAEWEFAARGGNKSKNYKYSGSNNINDVAWYEGNADGVRHHRHSALKKPNELGIFDMSGNVWEWCQDWYVPYNKNPRVNPTNNSSGNFRVIRGGTWNGVKRSCRCTNRNSQLPETKSYYCGFRIAAYL